MPTIFRCGAVLLCLILGLAAPASRAETVRAITSAETSVTFSAAALPLGAEAHFPWLFVPPHDGIELPLSDTGVWLHFVVVLEGSGVLLAAQPL